MDDNLLVRLEFRIFSSFEQIFYLFFIKSHLLSFCQSVVLYLSTTHQKQLFLVSSLGNVCDLQSHCMLTLASWKLTKFYKFFTQWLMRFHWDFRCDIYWNFTLWYLLSLLKTAQTNKIYCWITMGFMKINWRI